MQDGYTRIEMPYVNQLANRELITPRRSLKNGILGKSTKNHVISPNTKKGYKESYSSAMMNAAAQIAVQMPIHVSHPVHECDVMWREW